MKKVLLVALAVFVLLVGTFSLLPKKTSLQSTTQQEMEEATKLRKDTPLVETVIPQQNNSGYYGDLAIIELDGKVQVDITMNKNEGMDQPVHLHTGTCDNPGQIVYSLNPVHENRSVTLLDVSADAFKKSLPLVLNVHKSEAAANVYVACTDISTPLHTINELPSD